MPTREVHLTIESWPGYILALMAPAALIKQVPSSALGQALQGIGTHTEVLEDQRTIKAQIAGSGKSPSEIAQLLQGALTALFNGLGCTVSLHDVYGL